MWQINWNTENIIWLIVGITVLTLILYKYFTSLYNRFNSYYRLNNNENNINNNDIINSELSEELAIANQESQMIISRAKITANNIINRSIDQANGQSLQIVEEMLQKALKNLQIDDILANKVIEQIINKI
jgi:F0F1-type ATP synthase membrane subunit b/b'